MKKRYTGSSCFLSNSHYDEESQCSWYRMMARFSTRNSFISRLLKLFLRVFHPGLGASQQGGRLKPGFLLDGFTPKHAWILCSVFTFCCDGSLAPRDHTTTFMQPPLTPMSTLTRVEQQFVCSSLQPGHPTVPQDALQGSMSSFTGDYSGGKMFYGRGTATKYSTFIWEMLEEMQEGKECKRSQRKEDEESRL